MKRCSGSEILIGFDVNSLRHVDVSRNAAIDCLVCARINVPCCGKEALDERYYRMSCVFFLFYFVCETMVW